MAEDMDERAGTGKRKKDIAHDAIREEEDDEVKEEDDEMATAAEEYATDRDEYNATDKASTSGDSGETDDKARLVTPGRTEEANSGDEFHDSQAEEPPERISTYHQIVGNFLTPKTVPPVPNKWTKELTDADISNLATALEANANANEETFTRVHAARAEGKKTSGETEADYSFLETPEDPQAEDSTANPYDKVPAYTVTPNDYFNHPRVRPTGREESPPMVNPYRLNVVYFDLQIQLDDPKKVRKDAQEILFSRIKAFLKAYFEKFPDAVFHPFQEEDRELHDENLSADDYEAKLGTSLVKIKKFFYKAIPYYTGGTQYVRYLVGQEHTWQVIEAELFAWWKQNGFKVYKKTCQIEDSIMVGWAFRSHGTIDKDVLAKEISRWCRFPVGLQWRFIDLEEGEGNVKALHFEVDKLHAAEDRLYLAGLFHAKKTYGWPFHVKLRFVPILAHSGNDTAAEAILNLYSKQYAWTSPTGLKHWPTRDVQEVDSPKTELGGKTLRDYIMGIQSNTRKGIPLFTGINRHWEKRTQWMITAVPQVRSEAYRTFHGLLTYMRHYEKPDPPTLFDSLFEPEAKVRARGTAWDKQGHGTLSYETVQVTNIDGSVDADMEDILLRAQQQQQQQQQPARTSAQKRSATDISIDLSDSVESIAMAEIRAPAPGTPGFREALAAQPPGTRIVAYNEGAGQFVFQRPGSANAGPPNTRARYGDGQASRPARRPSGSRPQGGGRARGGGRDDRI
jgi:hypothetical protein